MAVVNIRTTKRRYATILADPPWPYRQVARRTHDATKALEYPTMSMDEIRNLPVRRIVSEACMLFLWITNPFLDEAFTVIEAWGFEYRTAATWVKPRPTTGTWFLGQTEHLLLAVRGKPPLPARRRPGLIRTLERQAHSVKPRESYELVESMSQSPRIELFARRARPGWDSWGLEAKEISKELEHDLITHL